MAGKVWDRGGYVHHLTTISVTGFTPLAMLFVKILFHSNVSLAINSVQFSLKQNYFKKEVSSPLKLPLFVSFHSAKTAVSFLLLFTQPKLLSFKNYI